MPPKRVPGVAYSDVHAYWKRYGCSPGPCYPIPDSISYSFAGDDVGFIPSPGLAALKVWINETSLELKTIEELRDITPPLDLNEVATIGLMAAWDEHNERLTKLENRWNELFDMRCKALESYYKIHQSEFEVYLHQRYPQCKGMINVAFKK